MVVVSRVTMTSNDRKGVFMFRKLIALVLLCGGMGVALAQEGPDATVRRVVDEVVGLIKDDKAIRAGDTQRAVEIVEQKVIPYTDMPRMTGLALGRDWRAASNDQKAALTREFQTMIVRTYSNVLIQYKDEQIVVKPFKGKAEDERAIVNTEVRKPGSKPVLIDYELIRKPEGWRVYDVVVADVSLVTNYRDSFAQEIREKGLDGLISSLQAKNKQPAGKGK